MRNIAFLILFAPAVVMGGESWGYRAAQAEQQACKTFGEYAVATAVLYLKNEMTPERRNYDFGNPKFNRIRDEIHAKVKSVDITVQTPEDVQMTGWAICMDLMK